MCFSDYLSETWIQKSPALLDHLTAYLAAGCQDALIILGIESWWKYMKKKLCPLWSIIYMTKHAKVKHLSQVSGRKTSPHFALYLFRVDESLSTAGQNNFQNFLLDIPCWSCRNAALENHNNRGKFSLGCSIPKAYCTIPSPNLALAWTSKACDQLP